MRLEACVYTITMDEDRRAMYDRVLVQQGRVQVTV